MDVKELIKECKKCKKILTLNDFHIGNNGAYFSECKDCHKIKCLKKRKKQYIKNRETILQKQRERYKAKTGESLNIIDVLDEFLSLHGVDFLKLVKERNKKKGWVINK